MAPRLRSLTVEGFRSYGATKQVLNLPSDIAVVWGPNSTGKTSLAEAIEFLLTGRIARRELMASSKDEFADALRNAHLPPGQQVSVAATITAPDGSSHQVKRVLLADYAKKQDCKSRLEINGQPVAEQDLAGIGISLSQPPLAAPVLAQHTRSVTSSPSDRRTGRPTSRRSWKLQTLTISGMTLLVCPAISLHPRSRCLSSSIRFSPYWL